MRKASLGSGMCHTGPNFLTKIPLRGTVAGEAGKSLTGKGTAADTQVVIGKLYAV